MRRVLIWIAAVASAMSGEAQIHQEMQGPRTSLASLVAEAQRQNAQVSRAEHAWRAATYRPEQVTALPDPQITVQDLSVGSPKPWAGFLIQASAGCAVWRQNVRPMRKGRRLMWFVPILLIR